MFQLVGRERKLDAALIQSGKFKDALESLMTWLRDTEELVLTNVKPLSADYKLLKTQMQEQKVRCLVYACDVFVVAIQM